MSANRTPEWIFNGGLENHEDMTRSEAVQLLQEAIDRIRRPVKNYSGGAWQAGGCYWRMMKVLHDFVVPGLVEEEHGHRFVLAERFGVPLPFVWLPTEMREVIAQGLREWHSETFPAAIAKK